MTKTAFRYILMYAALVLAQVVVFNNLVLFGCAVPLPFIYLIICLPATLSTNKSVTVGFLTGLLVDAFSDTYGLNALACTVLAFVRKPILHLYVSRDEDPTVQPLTMKSLGTPQFSKFAVTMTLIYMVVYFVGEAFNFFNFERMLLRIVASTLYTFVLVSAISSLSVSQREKKL